MTEMSLSEAVFKFGSVTKGLSAAELEHEWTWQAYNEGVRFAFFRTYEELRQLATTMATERTTAGPAVTTAQRALAQYHGAYRDLQAVLLGVGDDLVDRPPAQEEWPLRIILGHIQAAERQFFSRIWYAVNRQRMGNDRPIQMPDDEVEAFVGSWDDFERMMDDESLAGILAHYDALHERILHELADIGEDELSAPSLWWEGYEVPVQFRLHRLDSHLRQHTVQVEKTLNMLDHRPSEAKRLLRLIYGALAEAEGVMVGAWDIGQDYRGKAAATIASRTDEIAKVIAG
jgi:hypothetical protein